jgi:hypothetical protein
MMFGHLKAEDFTNLMDGAPLAEKRRLHLESCARCAETLRSVEAIRAQVTEMQMAADEHIPEPDWSEFRGDVRNALLSRSVKRENASSLRRSLLSGLAWRPAAAWGMAAVLVFAMTTGVMVWNQELENEETTAVQAPPVQPALGSAATIDAIAGMTQTDVFDDVLELTESETESLQRLLEDLTRQNAESQ